MMAALIFVIVMAFISIRYAPNLIDRGQQWMYPLNYKSEIIKYSEEYSLDPYLMFALIRTESAFDSKAVSSAGAIGLAQIMPETGQWLAGRMNLEIYSEEMLYIPETNIELSCYYVNMLLARFGTIETALAAYNAGSTTVSTWLEDSRYSQNGVTLTNIPYEETREYVERISDAMDSYVKIYPDLI